MIEYTLEDITPNTSILLKKDYACIHTSFPFSEEKVELPCNEIKFATLLGQKLNEVLPQLFEQDLISIKDGDIIIPYDSFSYLYESDSAIDSIGYGLSEYLPQYSPFFIKIDSIRDLGSPDFKYDCNFYWGAKQVYPSIIGCFLIVKSKVYYLENNLFSLLRQIDDFNQLPSSQKTKIYNLKAFSKIKELISKINYIETDKFLENENVVLPDKVKLNIVKTENGLSIEPSLENLNETSFQKQYEMLNDVQDVYDTDKDGVRTRVVLDNDIKLITEKLKQKYSNRKISEIQNELKKPELIFEDIEGIDQDLIDYSGYSERVKGIGALAFKARGQFSSTSVNFLEDIDYTNLDEQKRRDILSALQPKLIAQSIDDETVEIPVTEEIVYIIYEAIQSNQDVVSLYDSYENEIIIPITNDIKDFIYTNRKLLANDNETEFKKNVRKYLIIYDNYEEENYTEINSDSDSKTLVYNRPENLNSYITNKKGKLVPLELYEYQKEGVAWLETSFNCNNKNGALLADDMGLGKTIQVLTFLSWLIETKEKEQKKIDPILIVAPPILLQNWYDEICKYFKNNGEVFSPITILHGDALKFYKKENVGPESILCKSSLCVDCDICKYNTARGCSLNRQSLQHNRVIITNYDTVKNYQFSLAKIRWSAVILDEAQYIKNPDTAVSRAVKAMNSELKLAMTGTPVENKLLDLWSIMDFAIPGLLGTRKNFSNEFDIKNNTDFKEKERRLNSLKETLKLVKFTGLNKLNVIPHLLRREKNDYLSDKLPMKYDGKDAIRIECEIPVDMAEIHQALIEQASMSSGKKYLLIIQQLTKLYQHKYLLEANQHIYSAQEYLNSSPKLQATIKVLEEIKKKGEKVLIFLTSRNMQNILKKVIESEFNITVDIINGSINNSVSVNNDRKGTRYRILDDFENKDGFNVLILSPHVAGTGLTILGANHVIHYGRWWNPAKESQATDRAYRIGQQKEVFVYYPIYKSKCFETFDEKLDRLIEAKRELAKNFLTPISELEVTARDILNDCVNENSNIESVKKEGIDLKNLSNLEFKKLIYFIYKKQNLNIKILQEEASFGFDLVIKEMNSIKLFKIYNQEITELDIDLFIQNVYRYNKNGDNFIFVNYNLPKHILKYAIDNSIQIFDRKDLEQLVKKNNVYKSNLLALIPDKCPLL